METNRFYRGFTQCSEMQDILGGYYRLFSTFWLKRLKQGFLVKMTIQDEREGKLICKSQIVKNFWSSDFEPLSVIETADLLMVGCYQ